MKYFLCLFFLSTLHGDEFEEGIKLIHQNDYVQASRQFHLAAKSGNTAALFGEAVCDVALGKQHKAAQHLKELACTSCREEEQPLSPSEKNQVIAYNCRQRVRKVTKELRYLVEKMVAETVPGFLEKIRTFRRLNPYIDQLERNGIACCQNNQTGESCTEPLVEQLKLWNSEGLPK